MSRSFSLMVFLVLMVLSVDALFLQAELAAWGSTPLPNLSVKVVLIFLVLAGAVSQMVSGRGGPVPRPIFVLWLTFVIYLLVEVVILVTRFGYSAAYVLFSFNAYYFAILLLPVLFYLRQSLDESAITRTLLLFFVPLGLVGMAQNLFGDPLLPTESPNGYLQVWSWDFLGSIRAFSLFSSPSMFGHFIAIIAGLGMAFYLAKNGSAIKGAVVVLLALICGYCTLTRATLLEIVCAMFTVWALYRCKSYRLVLALCPILYGILGLLVAFVLPVWFVPASEEGLFSNLSIFQRYGEWTNYGALWLGGGLSTILFGAGLAQTDKFQTSADVVVDNAFLAVGIHIGAIGLALWFAIAWYVWAYMLEQSKKSPSPIRAASLGAWSVWILTSVFNVTIFYLLPFLLLLLTKERVAVSQASPEQRAASPYRRWKPESQPSTSGS